MQGRCFEYIRRCGEVRGDTKARCGKAMGGDGLFEDERGKVNRVNNGRLGIGRRYMCLEGT